VKFKVDENLPVVFAERLRDAGHEAETVNDEGLSGADDVDVARACLDEGRVLVTEDTDFANIVAYPPARYPGIVALRTRISGFGALRAFDLLVIPRLARTASLAGSLWVVDDTRIRIRP
jgi:hypothetical protein